MDIKPDTSRVLMSDTLKKVLPDLDGDNMSQLVGEGIYVVADRRVGGQQLPLAGVLRSVLFDIVPEIEMRIELSEALAVVQTEGLTFESFELHHGEQTTVKLPGPFTVKAARIEEIDVPAQLCVLLLQLQRVKKA